MRPRLPARLVRAVARSAERARDRAVGDRRARRPSAGRRGGVRRDGTADYPGDFRGTLRPVYTPDLDGDPDPGEIVWTWVPFEEDHHRGKDRPVLVVGHDGPWLLGLLLSSRDHDTRPGPRHEVWVDLGTGDWDARRRPSEVRLDRVVRVDPAQVRREGAVLDRRRFDLVVAAMR